MFVDSLLYQSSLGTKALCNSGIQHEVFILTLTGLQVDWCLIPQPGLETNRTHCYFSTYPKQVRETLSSHGGWVRRRDRMFAKKQSNPPQLPFAMSREARVTAANRTDKVLAVLNLMFLLWGRGQCGVKRQKTQKQTAEQDDFQWWTGWCDRTELSEI